MTASQCNLEFSRSVAEALSVAIPIGNAYNPITELTDRNLRPADDFR